MLIDAKLTATPAYITDDVSQHTHKMYLSSESNYLPRIPLHASSTHPPLQYLLWRVSLIFTVKFTRVHITTSPTIHNHWPSVSDLKINVDSKSKYLPNIPHHASSTHPPLQRLLWKLWWILTVEFSHNHITMSPTIHNQWPSRSDLKKKKNHIKSESNLPPA